MFDHARSVAALAGRVIIGVIFVVHGWMKVADIGLGATAASFEDAGIPLAGIAGPGVAFLELAGGAALVIGAALPVFACLLALDMLGAIVFVHGSHGFSSERGGYEYVLALAAGCLLIAFSGGGALAVDGLWRRRREALTGGRVGPGARLRR
jgi:putative oxidoreductase